MRRCRDGLAIASIALVVALAPDDAAAGEYTVGNCAADQLTFNTRAFDDFATRGMKIRRACKPEGPGLRGLITGNVTRGGQVPRGAVALVTMNAPPGTRFTTFTWGGEMRRQDCRYALEMWADAPDMPAAKSLKNVRANQRCPRPRRVQGGIWPVEHFTIRGATRIVQRVICKGDRKRKSCSARGTNYIQTQKAEVGIEDVSPPTAAIIADTPLARAEWVRVQQPLNYEASDNVGVRRADVVVAGKTTNFEARACAFAVPERTFAEPVPCLNGPGRIDVDTTRLAEGTQTIAVRAQDTAGNIGDSPGVTARIDNTPPGRVDVNMDGGDAWRNRNDFALTWTNPGEPDRAPIVAARYKLCSASGGSCSIGEQAGAAISRLGIPVPGPGEWSVSLWRRDAAGNEIEQAASAPVTLRFDPEPPVPGFEAPSAADPTLVAVSVTDKVSGLAGGTVEISPAGSGTWQALPTELAGSRLLARIDDAAVPAGAYQLRARAVDQAGNEASTERRLDGQAMNVTLPLRIGSMMRAGFERVRVVKRTIHRNGKQRIVRRRATILTPATRVRAGGHARIAGQLVNRDGQGIAGAEVRVLSSSSVSPEQLVAVVQTGGDGRFRYKIAGSTSRTIRLAFPGSPLVLPAEREMSMRVPARTSLRVSRKWVLNGQAVTFTGVLNTLPTPPGGKLVELQARLSDRWQTFRTARTDSAGRWNVRYRFKRTRGVQQFRFRARLPAEASYPFASGGSSALAVRVRGL